MRKSTEKSNEPTLGYTVRFPESVLLKARSMAKKKFSSFNAYIVNAVKAANNGDSR